MAPNDLTVLIEAEPRARLTLYLADGTQHEIAPEDIAYVAMTTLHVGRERDETGLPNATDYIDARMVVRVHAVREERKERNR